MRMTDGCYTLSDTSAYFPIYIKMGRLAIMTEEYIIMIKFRGRSSSMKHCFGCFDVLAIIVTVVVLELTSSSFIHLFEFLD
jgi:hypothetical protein